jgi:hypothetical protein
MTENEIAEVLKSQIVGIYAEDDDTVGLILENGWVFLICGDFDLYLRERVIN